MRSLRALANADAPTPQISIPPKMASSESSFTSATEDVHTPASTDEEVSIDNTDMEEVTRGNQNRRP